MNTPPGGVPAIFRCDDMPTRQTRKRPTGVKARTRVIRKGKLYKPTKKTRIPLVIT